ncbi:TraI domain-containing protein [Citrobacter koseri]|uniref:TraI domain-containing protein n=1 Tax=Citrobacter koseri TaxID=545 RepID=UPI001FCADF5F|nr:TraI domain-containing protein [Citrobacter koseri]
MERQKLIRILRENCPLSQAACDEFWLKPLQQLAGRVQEVPAAWTGPFSSPGGFIDLSLSVAAGSVRLVRGMMLPPGATPEEQSEQGPAWVCAVFWAGLFHHLDWLSLVEGSLAGGKPWYPGMEMPGANWRVRPRQGGGGDEWYVHCQQVNPGRCCSLVAALACDFRGAFFVPQWSESAVRHSEQHHQ